MSLFKVFSIRADMALQGLEGFFASKRARNLGALGMMVRLLRDKNSSGGFKFGRHRSAGF